LLGLRFDELLELFRFRCRFWFFDFMILWNCCLV